MTIVKQDRIARVSLADSIRSRLREQILSGAVAMGARLTEQGVAEAMGTSAGPVREAFAALTVEGLLLSLPNRGTFVTSVSKEEARSAYEVRHRLELLAFTLARQRLTESDYAELDTIVAEMKAAAVRSDYATMIGFDMAFHNIFYTRSGNPFLAAIWPHLEATIRKFVAVAGPQYTRDLIDLARVHQEMLDNVRSGNLKAVGQELKHHGQDIWTHMPDKRQGP